MRAEYPALLGSKLWLKLHTPIGRFANTSALELDAEEAVQTAESVHT